MQVKTSGWNNLSMLDRKIIMSICFDGSLEKAQKSLKLSNSQLQKHLVYLNESINNERLIQFKESLRKVLIKSS